MSSIKDIHVGPTDTAQASGLIKPTVMRFEMFVVHLGTQTGELCLRVEGHTNPRPIFVWILGQGEFYTRLTLVVY